MNWLSRFLFREQNQKLNTIIQQLEKLIVMGTTQKQFDDQLADFMADISTQTKAITDAVQSIIDKNAKAGSPLDLTAESETLTHAKAALDSIATSLPTTPTPTPAPTPTPVPAASTMAAVQAPVEAAPVTEGAATPVTPITPKNQEPGPQPVPAQPAVEAVPPPAEASPEPPINP